MPDTTTEAGARSDGQPKSVPVWFLWDGEGFLIYSEPGRQKLRNVGRNPRVGLHLNSGDRGDDVVRVEGRAGLPDGFAPAEELPGYVEKYRKAIAGSGAVVQFLPRRWR